VAARDDPGPIAEHLRDCAACAAYVARLEREAAAFRAGADPAAFARAVQRRAAEGGARRFGTVAGLVGAFAAAAAVLFWLRTPHVEVLVPETSDPSPSDVVRFKGDLAVTAIRERGGRQERLTGPFDVVPGDRLRLEIAVDRPETLTAGLLWTGGAWTVLQPPIDMDIGTHYSDLAARFDDRPGDAWLLVGPPDVVERARATGDLEGVVHWRVEGVRPR
jgi:hypothetical protein